MVNNFLTSLLGHPRILIEVIFYGFEDFYD